MAVNQADEQPGLAGRLDGGLLDSGGSRLQVVFGGCGDGDESGVAADAAPTGEVSFLLEHIVVLGGLGGVVDLADLLALGLVGDVLGLLAASRAT